MPNFVAHVSVTLGITTHVTVYTAAGVAVPPAQVTLAPLPSSITAAADATGFNITASTVGDFSNAFQASTTNGSVVMDIIVSPQQLQVAIP